MARNDNFARPPHLTAPEWLGLATMIAWPLILILAATQIPQFHCHPGDRSTTNGRDLCPPHEVRR